MDCVAGGYRRQLVSAVINSKFNENLFWNRGLGKASAAQPQFTFSPAFEAKTVVVDRKMAAFLAAASRKTTASKTKESSGSDTVVFSELRCTYLAMFLRKNQQNADKRKALIPSARRAISSISFLCIQQRQN